MRDSFRTFFTAEDLPTTRATVVASRLVSNFEDTNTVLPSSYILTAAVGVTTGHISLD